MSIPSTVGQNGHETPPKTTVEFMTVREPYELEIGTCHLPLHGLNHEPQLRPSIPLKELMAEIRSEALCALRKLAQQVFRQVFSGKYFMSSILTSPRI